MKKYQVNLFRKDKLEESWEGEATNAIDALFKAHESFKNGPELNVVMWAEDKKCSIEIVTNQ